MTDLVLNTNYPEPQTCAGCDAAVTDFYFDEATDENWCLACTDDTNEVPQWLV